MEKANQLGLHNVHVHLIRAVAITAAILVHAAGRWLITSQELNQLPPLGIVSWSTVLIYQCLAVLGVPLFLMLSGLLLLHPEKLQPEKKESLRVFFKKRFTRIGLPFIFWTPIYFVWVYLTQNIPLTPGVIIQGTLNGAYTQFWYIYVLFGLYILTPLLRIIIIHAGQTLIKYFLGLWLIGAAILPFFSLIFPYQLNHNVFTITGYVGYFILGVYLCWVQPIDRKKTLGAMLLGITLTALGTYVLMVSGAGEGMYFFQAYLSPTVILASTMAFLLLLTVRPPSNQQKTKPALYNKLITTISQNTLGIFFVHVIVIETIQRGYVGFMLNREILNPIIEVPLLTIITLFISLGIILLLKKIPHIEKVVT
ncbi:MAG: acyltransferase family protein [Nitrososphaerota archaeon]|jgi:surface polysaccharide O-acyltransferase-like enzyme|nr:acyltransferase family protein [Nitrososphaerota archaeon]